MPDSWIRYELDTECQAAIVELNRPTTRNALSNEVIEQLLSALRRGELDEQARSLIITGAGTVFASGADLDELAERDHITETESQSAKRRAVTSLLEKMSKPTIAAINGHAVGGGLELALACTFRIMALEAKMRLPEVSLGILPGNGGTQRLVRLVGVGRAFSMVLLSEAFEGREAEQAGLVHLAVPADSVMAEALSLASRLASMPRRALTAAKESVLMAWDVPIDVGLAYENKWFAILCGSPDKEEGIRAFRERRPPQFPSLGVHDD